MPAVNAPVPANYDTRWFIWTIVFLVVVGVGLTAYIVVTSTNDTASADQVVLTPPHGHNAAPQRAK